MQLIGQGKVATLVGHNLIGRLMVMFVRQPGLALVYQQILGFDGCMFYTENWVELAGTTAANLAEKFPNAVPVGVNRGGEIILNLAPDFVFQETDGLVVIAADNDTYQCEEPAFVVEVTNFVPDRKNVFEPEKVLIAGWRTDIKDMLLMLDKLLAPGSEARQREQLRCRSKSTARGCGAAVPPRGRPLPPPVPRCTCSAP